MQVIIGKIRKGIGVPIKPTQKDYAFMCPPVADINIGDYVLVDVYFNDRQHFQVVRVENVLSLEEYKETISKAGEEPYSYVVCKLPVKDFDKRCKTIQDLKKTTRNRNLRVAHRERLKRKKLKKLKKGAMQKQKKKKKKSTVKKNTTNDNSNKE